MDDTSNLTQLGSKKTEYKSDHPCAEMLEIFENRFTDRDYLVVHETSEFTSLCPKTGQPDFATIKLEFVPDRLCIESKSLKLYLFAWRSEGSFMETIVNRMLNDFVLICEPRWMKVTGLFGARGGIATSVFAEYKKPG